MSSPHHIVVIVGSLRKESFTLKIANALAKLAPPALKLDVVTLHGISFFNQDLEATPPADWVAFRERIQKSAGVIFVTPEYNRAISGVLKNAIDVALASLWQELIPRQAGRHHLQFAGTAGGRQRGKNSAERPSGHFRSDHGAAGNLSEWGWGRL